MSKSKYQKMTVEQIIDDLDIVKKAIEYHYDIETEALNTDDVYNGKLLDFIADELAESDDDAMAWSEYEKIAEKIMDVITDDLVEEINDRDRAAIEDKEERREAMKGNY